MDDSELARTLASHASSGVLSTLSKAPAGFPFGSVAALAVDATGSPLLRLSDLAEHSHNLAADPRASVLITEAGEGDPLAFARVTLLGTVRVLDGAERDAAHEVYRAVHPNGVYADFHDFRTYRLDVRAVRYVGGFARMSWVSAADYAAAEPDPLFPYRARIVGHMNDDHGDSLVAFCRTLAALPGTTSARMLDVDRHGFAISSDASDEPVRIEFDEECRTPDAVRAAMVALVRRLP
jgi:putative heme iron utilization protein